MISTLWGNHIKLGLGVLDEPLAVIFVSDPSQPQEAPAELLQRLYGLTPSEARLLEQLVAGKTVENAGNAIGIKLSTARVYLKVIFQKTNTNRQPELLQKVQSSPIWAHTQNQSNKAIRKNI